MNLYDKNLAITEKKESYNEDSAFDNLIYCDKCNDFVYAYCSIHGPLLVIPDDKVSSKPKYPSLVPRAALTIPSVFLHLAPSRIPGSPLLNIGLPKDLHIDLLEATCIQRLLATLAIGGGVGVFSTLTLPRGVRFGPYRGRRTHEIRSMYCWQLYDGHNKPSHVVDAADANNSNWMRYVNCARHWCEQNLVAYQYRGQLYYRTVKTIPSFTELLVFYGAEYANYLKIDLRRYNSNSHQLYKLTGTPFINNIQNERNNIQNERTVKEDFSIENDDSIINPDESSNNYNVGRNINEIMNEQDNENRKYFNCGKENHDKSEFNTKIQVINENTENEYDFNSKSFTFNKYNSISNNENVNISNEDTEENKNTSGQMIDKNNINEINTDRKEMSVDIPHTKNKTWQCPHCNKILSRKTKQIRHYSTHIVKFSCNLCPYQTNIETDFRKHEVRHNQMVQFVCDICHFISTSKYNISRHKRTLHKIITDGLFISPK